MESNKEKIEWKQETRHIIAILDLLGASEMIMGDKSEIAMNGISGMFKDAETDKPAVLYKRKDENYGIIESE